MSSFREELSNHFEAGAPAVWVTTHEETRILSEIVTLGKSVSIPIYQWSSRLGVIAVTNKKQMYDNEGGLPGAITWFVAAAMKPCFAILCDPHEYLEKGLALRTLREALEVPDIHFIIISPKDTIPFELSRRIVPLRFALPTRDDLTEAFRKTMKGSELTKLQVSMLAESAVGLTSAEASIALRLAMLRHGLKNLEDASQEIWNTKAKMFNSEGLVVTRRPSETFDLVGGCFELKKFLTARMKCFSQEAREKGVQTPRGILLAGPPGVGKSLISKAIANFLGYPFISWDVGRWHGPYVGMTEQNTDRGLEFTAAHSPCVVQIDEIAYQMSGFESSGYTDSGVTSRQLGKILTFMQDRGNGIFFVATTTEPWRLPLQMHRSGRFDGVFALGLPGRDGMEEILSIQLSKHCKGLELSKDETKELTSQMVETRFSGAEVEQAVIEAVQISFPGTPTYRTLMETTLSIVPSSTTMEKEVKKLEEWGKAHARPA